MLNETLAVARGVTRGINLLERRGIAVLEESNEFVGTILKARRKILAEFGKGALPIGFGLAAIETAAAASQSISQAMRQVAECHQQLAADKVEAGLEAVALGDEWPCLTGQVDGPTREPAPLRIVA